MGRFQLSFVIFRKWIELQACVVTVCCVFLVQIVTPVASLLVDLDAPGVAADAVHEHLDVNPELIAPVDSPLKHLETVQSDKKYVDFINDLYKKDKSKTPLTFEQKSRK